MTRVLKNGQSSYADTCYSYYRNFCFSLTLKYTDEATGITRTGLQGLKLYLIPNFKGVTFKQFFLVIMDAMGQLFYSISVAMGIMVAYGSYVPDKTNINKSINQIEIFDTVVAILAGLMIVPAVYVFAGTEGMSAGPGLMFISLPKVFNQMGKVGTVIGIVFFLMVILRQYHPLYQLWKRLLQVLWTSSN